MVRKFGPFDTSQFYEVENRRMQRAFNPQTGFVATGQGAVTAGTGAQLVIAAYPDGALIDGLYVENPQSETITLTTNTGSTNPRIDRLVLRLDMTAHTIAPFQIVGTPAASPAAPPLVRTSTVVDLPLCRYTMPGNASAQNPGSIIDERLTLLEASGLVPRFGTDAARDAATPAGVDGVLAVVGTRLMLRRAGVWAKQGGSREVLYENGNAATTGWVGAGQLANAMAAQVNAPVAADTGHLHFAALMQAAAGTSQGTIVVTYAGVTYSQVYNVDTGGGAVVIEMPVSVPAGTSQALIQIAGGSGEAGFMAYSALRITI